MNKEASIFYVEMGGGKGVGGFRPKFYVHCSFNSTLKMYAPQWVLHKWV